MWVWMGGVSVCLVLSLWFTSVSLFLKSHSYPPNQSLVLSCLFGLRRFHTKKKSHSYPPIQSLSCLVSLVYVGFTFLKSHSYPPNQSLSGLVSLVYGGFAEKKKVALIPPKPKPVLSCPLRTVVSFVLSLWFASVSHPKKIALIPPKPKPVWSCLSGLRRFHYLKKNSGRLLIPPHQSLVLSCLVSLVYVRFTKKWY